MKNFILSILLTLSLISLSGCGKSQEEVSTYDNSAEVEQFFKAHPDRFVFASIEDLPADLNWEDGSGLPEIGDPRAKRGGRLHLRLSSMQNTLRVLGPDANGSLRGPLWSANSVGLIQMHPWENGYTPGLAKAWAIDPDDPRKVYLRLDSDARWSDGRPFLVEDIFFSLYLLLSPHINDPAINRVAEEGYERLTRYDHETVSITLTKPSPDILSSISTYLLYQREFYREFGEDYVDRYHWRFSPVTGPYIVRPETVKRGQQITFERLESWWADDKPFYRNRFNPDYLTFHLIRDDSKAFESFLTGGVDWHSLNRTELWHDRDEAEAIQKGYIQRAWVYHQLPAARSGLYMNSVEPLLDKVDIRLGIQHAVDYQAVNEQLFRGDRRRIRSFADGYGSYSHPTLKAREYDTEKAQEYFGKAGFNQRGDDGILENDEGEKLSFELTVLSGGDDVQVATLLKEAAKRAGLELRINPLDPTSNFTATFEKKFQLIFGGWDTGYSSLPAFEWEIRGEDAGKPKNFNTTNIKDEELDAYLEEWDQLSDPIRAQEISHAIQERIHDYAAWVPGLTTGYSRMGYWSWVQWPDYFQVPRYQFFMASGVFWIDEELREETLEARKTGKTFPVKTKVYERWRE